jgi:hypothetical protein
MGLLCLPYRDAVPLLGEALLDPDRHAGSDRQIKRMKKPEE